MRARISLAMLFVAATAHAQNAMPGAWWPSSDMAAGRNVYVMAPVSGGRILVAGGSTMYGETGTELATVELWNPATGTWTPGNPLTMGRAWHAGALLDDGRVLVAGGNETATPTAETWSPATETWSLTNPMNGARWRHTATKLANGRVLVAGGAAAGVALATAEVFDPATNTWTPTANDMTTARANHRAIRLNDGRVLVAGGTDGNETVMTATAEIYDPATNLWTAAGAMNESRSMFGIALLPDGRVLAASGGIGNSSYRDTSEIWNPATGLWTVTASRVRLARSFPFAHSLADGRVLLGGGFNHTVGAGENVVNSHVKIAEIWDPATQSWHNTGSMVTARDYAFTHRLPDGRILVVGGDDGGFTPSNLRGAEVFDPASGTFKPFEFSRSLNGSPQFTMMAVDAQSDDVRYEVQFATDPAFPTPTMVNSSNGGFVNLVNGADTDPFTGGQMIGYTPPAFGGGATYWWRARFSDPAGANRYTGWTASRSVTIPLLVETELPYHYTQTAQLQRGRATSVNVTGDHLALGTLSQNTGTLPATTNPSGTWANATGPFLDGGIIASTATENARSVYGGFGAAGIPGGATVTGVIVSVDAFKSGSGGSSAAALDLELSLDGTTWSAPKRIDPLPTTEALRTQGSSGDLWGLAITPANAGNLQVRMTAIKNSSNPQWNVDWMRITVYYTAPAANGTWISPLVRNSLLANANGRNWASLSWTETAFGGCVAPACDATVDVLDMSGNPIPGFSSSVSPVSLLALNPAVHPAVRVRFNFVSGGAAPPEINDLTISTLGGTPLAANVSGLAATRSPDDVTVSWSADSNEGLLSFDVLRATAEAGPFAIVAQLDADDSPADYDWTDEQAPLEAWYALDVRGTDGSVTRIGPVLARDIEPIAVNDCACATTSGGAPSLALLLLALVLVRAART